MQCTGAGRRSICYGCGVPVLAEDQSTDCNRLRVPPDPRATEAKIEIIEMAQGVRVIPQLLGSHRIERVRDMPLTA